MKQKLILMRGLPGSGKSTFSKKYLDEHPANTVRVSRDDIRRMLSPIWSQDIEAIVYQVKWSAIRNALMRGYDVIVDECHSKVKAEDYEMFYQQFDITVEFWDVKTDTQTCIERNKQRSGVAQVDTSYIEEISEKFNWGEIPFPDDVDVTYKII